ncbi:MAG: hypothetical protein AB1634_14795 [Thermodesulfobacteriota bacterium]
MMAGGLGVIALMGSGELTASMVAVHQELLARVGGTPRAVFLDTPAGFQENAGEISAKAQDYFAGHVGRPLRVASLRRAGAVATLAGQEALAVLGQASYVLVGPGSPSYALRQWRDTPVPGLLVRLVREGGCLAAASAAALTVGRLTLPIYEIYKVGAEPHWLPGLDLLGQLGLAAVVVPHWNNAEGGSHDTRFCYLGERRFQALAALVSEDTAILGLDEHTACILDLETDLAAVRGLGSVTVRRPGQEERFRRGERFSLALLRPEAATAVVSRPQAEGPAAADPLVQLRESLAADDVPQALAALLDLEQRVRPVAGAPAPQDREGTALRQGIALLGQALARRPASAAACLAPLVDDLVALRQAWRQEGHWPQADGLRHCLARHGVEVRDTPGGSHWQLRDRDDL